MAEPRTSPHRQTLGVTGYGPLRRLAVVARRGTGPAVWWTAVAPVSIQLSARLISQRNYDMGSCAGSFKVMSQF